MCITTGSFILSDVNVTKAKEKVSDINDDICNYNSNIQKSEKNQSRTRKYNKRS